MRDWRLAVLPAIAAWAGALAYSSAAGRVMYGDGAWYVLVHLITPHRFNDYDFQRSFASFISQSPVLFGQRLGVDSVSVFAALYSFGALVIPAIALMASLVLARRQPLLLAANVVGATVYGFGTNFINTEANLLFGLVWLSVTIMALERPAPILRGMLLPLFALALLRSYEGMLLVGPFMCLWALLAAHRTQDWRERFGLTLAALLFFLGAVIGLGGFLSPRDPGNASSFLGSALRYLGNPHVFTLLAALLAFVAVAIPARRLQWACAAASLACGVAFLAALARLQGFYGFDVYYHNRSFMVLSLPMFVAALLAAYHFRPAWLAAHGAREAYPVLLVPLAFAIAGDVFGTHRWSEYVAQFCSVLAQERSPAERLVALKAAGVRTAWPWTHPTMSVLLRDRGSNAMITNEPGGFGWEPFDPARAPVIPYRGFCQAPLLGPTRPDSFDVPIHFTGGRFPTHVARVRGLSTPEAWGTWSVGDTVTIEFARPLPRSFDLQLRLGTAYGSNRELPVRVRAGAKEQEFTVDAEPFEATLRFRDVGEANSVSFAIPKPQSPLETGRGNDPRKLGIGFVSMRVHPR